MAKIKISIITPTRNRAQFIERTIKSVQEQGVNYEHIILDADSEDETGQIIAKYPITYIKKEANSPLTERLNLGFKLATGNIIGWINSDDTYESGAFKKVFEFMMEHPKIDMIYSDCKFIDENDEELSIWKTAPFSYFRNLNYAQMMPQPTVFFRKEILNNVGYMNEEYNYAMDYEFFIRVSKKCRIAYLPVILANFRLHKNSKTMSQREKFEPEVEMIRKKQGAIIPYSAFKLLNKIIGLAKRRH